MPPSKAELHAAVCRSTTITNWVSGCRLELQALQQNEKQKRRTTTPSQSSRDIHIALPAHSLSGNKYRSTRRDRKKNSGQGESRISSHLIQRGCGTQQSCAFAYNVHANNITTRRITATARKQTKPPFTKHYREA